MSETPMFGGGKDQPEKKKAAPFEPQELQESSSNKSEEQFLEELRLMQTNFLFLYGDHDSGKSAICSTLLYSLMTTPEIGTFSPKGAGGTGQPFIDKAIEKIRNRRLLPRTPLDTVTLAGGQFRPKDRNYKAIPLTFMEMAGEDLRELVAPAGNIGFPKHVDVFLNDKSLNLVFMLVIRHDEATAKKDLMLQKFIDFIRVKDARYEKSRILLVLSQWDTYKGDYNVEEFVNEYLPLTNALLASSQNSIMAYSVGEFTKIDNEPYIAVRNTENPKKLIRWIYQTVTGNDFQKQSLWTRLSNLIK